MREYKLIVKDNNYRTDASESVHNFAEELQAAPSPSLSSRQVTTETNNRIGATVQSTPLESPMKSSTTDRVVSFEEAALSCSISSAGRDESIADASFDGLEEEAAWSDRESLRERSVTPTVQEQVQSSVQVEVGADVELVENAGIETAPVEEEGRKASVLKEAEIAVGAVEPVTTIPVEIAINSTVVGDVNLCAAPTRTTSASPSLAHVGHGGNDGTKDNVDSSDSHQEDGDGCDDDDHGDANDGEDEDEEEEEDDDDDRDSEHGSEEGEQDYTPSPPRRTDGKIVIRLVNIGTIKVEPGMEVEAEAGVGMEGADEVETDVEAGADGIGSERERERGGENKGEAEEEAEEAEEGQIAAPVPVPAPAPFFDDFAAGLALLNYIESGERHLSLPSASPDVETPPLPSTTPEMSPPAVLAALASVDVVRPETVEPAHEPISSGPSPSKQSSSASKMTRDAKSPVPPHRIAPLVASSLPVASHSKHPVQRVHPPSKLSHLITGDTPETSPLRDAPAGARTPDQRGLQLPAIDSPFVDEGVSIVSHRSLLHEIARAEGQSASKRLANVVEVSSLDPRAAARAAAILKLVSMVDSVIMDSR